MSSRSILIGIGLCFMTLGALLCAYGSIEGKKNEVELQVQNPYHFDASILLKCDWDNRKQTYTVNKTINIPSNKVTKVFLPVNLRNCELYPHINMF